jgi:hypothetical protein
MSLEVEPNDHMSLAKWVELLLELAILKQGEEAATLVLQVNSQCFHSFRLLTNALPVKKQMSHCQQ